MDFVAFFVFVIYAGVIYASFMHSAQGVTKIKKREGGHFNWNLRCGDLRAAGNFYEVAHVADRHHWIWLLLIFIEDY